MRRTVAETSDLIEEMRQQFTAEPVPVVLPPHIKRRYLGIAHMTETDGCARLFGDPGDTFAERAAPFGRRTDDIEPVEDRLRQDARIGLAPAGDLQTRDRLLVGARPGHPHPVSGQHIHGAIMPQKRPPADGEMDLSRPVAPGDLPAPKAHARQTGPQLARMNMPRPTLLFDLDGTLADTALDLCETMNVILEMHGRARVPQERVRHLVGGGARLLLERGFRETGAPADQAQLDRSFNEFIDYYSKHIADHTKLWPGVRDQLDWLAEREALLGVCTNKPEQLSRQLLEMLGIDRYFPVVIGGDTLPVKKPDPEHLFEAIRRLDGDAGHSVMVGDSDADVEAAKNARIPSICVSFGYTRVPVAELGADLVIDHFDAFPAALATLLPGHFGRA